MYPDQLWGPPSLLSNGYRGKVRPGRDADHTPYQVPSMSRSYTASPPCRLNGGSWTALFLLVSITVHSSVDEQFAYQLLHSSLTL
jgi:hypothetical protein